jgi:WD40 repeat protein
MGKRFDLDRIIGQKHSCVGSPKRKMHLILTGHSDEVSSVSLSSDGKRFNLDLTTKAFVCGISKAENDLNPEGHSDQVSLVSLSSDGKTL